ncbi:MAG TPA: DEAD/DEAH box helicase [Nanoarchaeota archaeon]|nr:DEAD/DEAH box helicase [Nanoarchaeota archaeon]
MYITHPLIKENTVEKRAYQENILKVAEKKNTLVVLPTGIGKTIIALLLAVKRIEKYPESQIMILAPSRPLAAQHKKTFASILNFPENEFQLVTGTIKPEKRVEKYNAKFIFSTPQTIQNDIKENRISLENFSLLVIDEAHRAVGNYPYVFIAKKYMVFSKNPLILALTASPGSDEEKIKEICNNLFIKAIEIKTEEDEDVKPYIKQVEIEVVRVDFDTVLENLRERLNKILKHYAEILKEQGFKFKTKKELIELQHAIGKKISSGDKSLFNIMKVIADALKVWHAIELLETQSITALKNYLNRLKETPQGKRIFQIEEFKEIYFDLLGMKEIHPKIKKLREIVENILKQNPNAKIIVFSHYRDNIEEIYEELKKVPNCKPCYLIGQAGEKGLSQKEQIKIIEAFENGEYNCLIGSPVSEEGLHIPAVDIGIFYDAVPSEIRLIQRRGRIGRVKFGKIIFILLRKSRDEAYYYTALRKEKKMKKSLKIMKDFGIRKKTLFDF